MAINNNEIGPIVYIICKSMLRILPNTKLNLCIIAKDFLKRNFAKSGHTAARDIYSLIRTSIMNCPFQKSKWIILNRNLFPLQVWRNVRSAAARRHRQDLRLHLVHCQGQGSHGRGNFPGGIHFTPPQDHPWWGKCWLEGTEELVV